MLLRLNALPDQIDLHPVLDVDLGISVLQEPGDEEQTFEMKQKSSLDMVAINTPEPQVLPDSVTRHIWPLLQVILPGHVLRVLEPVGDQVGQLVGHLWQVQDQLRGGPRLGRRGR